MFSLFNLISHKSGGKVGFTHLLLEKMFLSIWFNFLFLNADHRNLDILDVFFCFTHYIIIGKGLLAQLHFGGTNKIYSKHGLVKSCFVRSTNTQLIFVSQHCSAQLIKTVKERLALLSFWGTNEISFLFGLEFQFLRDINKILDNFCRYRLFYIVYPNCIG